MPLAVEHDETANPERVRLLGAPAVMPHPDRRSHAIHETRRMRLGPHDALRCSIHVRAQRRRWHHPSKHAGSGYKQSGCKPNGTENSEFSAPAPAAPHVIANDIASID
jgi:hypothetical protein